MYWSLSVLLKEDIFIIDALQYYPLFDTYKSLCLFY